MSARKNWSALSSLARQWTVEDEEEVERERRRRVRGFSSSTADPDESLSSPHPTRDTPPTATTNDDSSSSSLRRGNGPERAASGDRAAATGQQAVSSEEQTQLDFVEMLRKRDEKRRLRHMETLSRQKEENGEEVQGAENGVGGGGGGAREENGVGGGGAREESPGHGDRELSKEEGKRVPPPHVAPKPTHRVRTPDAPRTTCISPTSSSTISVTTGPTSTTSSTISVTTGPTSPTSSSIISVTTGPTSPTSIKSPTSPTCTNSSTTTSSSTINTTTGTASVTSSTTTLTVVNRQQEKRDSLGKDTDPKPPSTRSRFSSSVSISLDKSVPSSSERSGSSTPMSPCSPTASLSPSREHWPSPCQSPSPRAAAQSPVHNGHTQETHVTAGSPSNGSVNTEQTSRRPAFIKQSSRTASFRMLQKKEEEKTPLQRSMSVRIASKKFESNTEQRQDEDKTSPFQRNSRQRMSSKSIQEMMERLAHASQKSDVTAIRSPDVAQRTLFLMDEVSRKRGLFEKDQQAEGSAKPGISRQELRGFAAGMSDRINVWLNKSNQSGTAPSPTDLRNVDITTKRSLFEGRGEDSLSKNTTANI